MKTSVTKIQTTPPPFQPATLHITIENQQEFDFWHALFNSGKMRIRALQHYGFNTGQLGTWSQLQTTGTESAHALDNFETYILK